MDVEKVEVTPKGVQGPLWTIAGTAIGGLATQWLRGGGLGGLFSGLGGSGTAAAAVGAGAGLNAIAERDAEIARLRSEKYTDEKALDTRDRIAALNEKVIGYVIDLDKKVSALETAQPLREQLLEAKIAQCAQSSACGLAQANAAIAQLNAVVASVTKIVVPNAAVCPGWGNVTITPAASTTTPAA